MSISGQLSGSPEEFARAAVTLAIRRFGFPSELEETAYVDGFGDLGIDGIAIALNGIPLADITAIPDDIPQGVVLDILFVQSKRPDIVKQDDIVLFGNHVRTFLTFEEDALKKLNPSEEIFAHWRVISTLRAQAPDIVAAADITLLFVFGGEWRDFKKVNIRRDIVLADLCNALKSSRVEFEIWGIDELRDVDLRYGDGAVRTLNDAQLMPLPSGKPSGYIGYVKAQSLVNFVSSRRPGKNEGYRTADDFLFLDNVRSFLEVDKKNSLRQNPGAVGLNASLSRGEKQSVLAGHNGIVIVADNASLADGAIELTNPQIVNGCQSAHVLISHNGRLDECYLPLKIVVTENEDEKDFIAIASNTQAEVDNYDILARFPNVKALELELGAAAIQPNERIWFQRRRNQKIDFPKNRIDDLWERIVRPRHLLDAFAATVCAQPHIAHSKPRDIVKLARDGIAFDAEHDPMLYRALSWMIVVGRKWANSSNRNWRDLYEYAGGRAYPARHQYIWALWNIVVPTPGDIEIADIERSRAVHDKFRDAIDKLMNKGDTLGDLAGQAVDNAVPATRRLNADLVGTKTFTENVAEAAAKLRP